MEHYSHMIINLSLYLINCIIQFANSLLSSAFAQKPHLAFVTTSFVSPSADTIIGVKTGAAVSYVALTLTIIIVIGGLAYLVNKKLLLEKIEI